MKIPVEYDISSVFSETVKVDGLGECKCGPDFMNPQVPCNLKTWKDCRVCATCGGQVRDIVNDYYNFINGYSGYDDVE
jgi:hypothetical protein